MTPMSPEFIAELNRVGDEFGRLHHERERGSRRRESRTLYGISGRERGSHLERSSAAPISTRRNMSLAYDTRDFQTGPERHGRYANDPNHGLRARLTSTYNERPTYAPQASQFASQPPQYAPAPGQYATQPLQHAPLLSATAQYVGPPHYAAPTGYEQTRPYAPESAQYPGPSRSYAATPTSAPVSPISGILYQQPPSSHYTAPEPPSMQPPAHPANPGHTASHFHSHTYSSSYHSAPFPQAPAVPTPAPARPNPPPSIPQDFPPRNDQYPVLGELKHDYMARMHTHHKDTVSQADAERYWWNCEGRHIPPRGNEITLEDYVRSVGSSWPADQAPTRGESKRRWECYKGWERVGRDERCGWIE